MWRSRKRFSVTDHLWIYTSDSSRMDGVDGNDGYTPGVYAYALAPLDNHELGNWEVRHEAIARWDITAGWDDGAWVDVYLHEADRSLDEWLALFTAILEPAVQLGATVAWLGGEDCSPSPTILRPPVEGRVLAAWTPNLGLVCRLEDPRRVEGLDDTALGQVWSEVVDAFPSLAEPDDSSTT